MCTDPASSNHYPDLLRACLIAALTEPATAVVRLPEQCALSYVQNTIKFAAMRLLNKGALTSGVELLCMVGCGLDAAKYLQAAGEWEAAARFVCHGFLLINRFGSFC